MLFPLAILAGLAFTKKFQIPGLARYDGMLIYCVAIQWAMLWRKMETVYELRAVCVFHLLGLGLEVHRTSLGAWSYPDPGVLRIGQVPLFSGFMYAGVASYLLQAWRRFKLTFDGLPPAWLATTLAVLGYASFFYFVEARPLLIGLILLSLVRARVWFTVVDRPFWMPVGLGFGFIGGAIWIGENAGTFLGAWRYPSQEHGWQMVDLSKLGAWFLLVAVGFVIVERLKAWEPRPKPLVA